MVPAWAELSDAWAVFRSWGGVGCGDTQGKCPELGDLEGGVSQGGLHLAPMCLDVSLKDRKQRPFTLVILR